MPPPLGSPTSVTPDLLVRRTTAQEHAEGRFGEALPPDIQEIVNSQVAALASRTRTADELWEWLLDGGDFSSAGGLAIVRDGQIVEAWVTWRS